MNEMNQLATEQKLAAIWKEVLQTPNEIGKDHSFFELGGDSIMMMMMLFQITRTFGVDVPPEEVFSGSRLGELAMRIDELCRVQSNEAGATMDTGSL